jgi:hypothetical protein
VSDFRTNHQLAQKSDDTQSRICRGGGPLITKDWYYLGGGGGRRIRESGIGEVEAIENPG